MKKKLMQKDNGLDEDYLFSSKFETNKSSDNYPYTYISRCCFNTYYNSFSIKSNHNQIDCIHCNMIERNARIIYNK